MAPATEATMAEAPDGYEIDLVNPPWIGYQLVTAASVCMALSTILLALRLFSRKFILRSLGWDDLLIVLAWWFAVTLSVGDIFQTKYGTGYHMWDVTVDHFGKFLILQVVVGMAYQTSLGLAKASICTFYLRLSPQKSFRIMAYCIIAFVAAYTTAGLAVIVFSCNPIAASWDLALAALPTTTCVNRPADYLAQAAFNIVADVAIFVLPLKTIWGLQLPIKQKLAVIGVFAAGLFVCIVSMVRLQSVIQVLNSTDLSYDTNAILIWSTIEAHVTIVCACVPTLKPLMSRYFPRIWGKSAPTNFSDNITGRSRKLGSKVDTRTYGLKSFAAQDKYVSDRNNTTIVGGGDGYDLGNESQERIIDGRKTDGVYVTTTVNVQ